MANGGIRTHRLAREEHVTGPNSLSNQTTRAILRAIDRSIALKTDEWLRPKDRTASFEQIAAEQDLFYCSRPKVGAEIYHHTTATLGTATRHLIERKRAPGVAGGINNLVSLGSEAIHPEHLADVSYEREREIRSVLMDSNGASQAHQDAEVMSVGVPVLAADDASNVQHPDRRRASFFPTASSLPTASSPASDTIVHGHSSSNQSVLVPVAGSRPFGLDNYALDRRLQRIFSIAKSAVFEELTNLSVAPESKAYLTRQPDESLKAIYATTFGQGLVGQHMAYAIEHLTAADLGISIIGAYLFARVLAREPISSADVWMGGLRDALGDTSRAMEVELGEIGTDLDTLMRRSLLRHVRQSSMQPSAYEHAMCLAGALHRHTVGDTEQQPSHAAMLRFSDTLGEFINDALGILCELDTAQEQYIFTWPVAGRCFEAATMRSLNGPGECVAVCLFPGLQMIKNGDSRTVFSSQVLLKAAPAT